MAFTVTTQFETVMGNKRVTVCKVTADAVSGVVDSQMGLVEGISFSAISMASASSVPILKPNLDAASAAANGKVFVSGVTSGDDFFVTMYGH